MKFETYIYQHASIQVIVDQLREATLNKDPSHIVCYYTEEYDAAQLSHLLSQAFPSTPIQGSSSCKGLISEKGHHVGPVVGFYVMYFDSNTISTTAITHLEEFGSQRFVTHNIRHTIESALEGIDRLGEIPDLVILHASPGCEEQIIQSLSDVFLTPVPVIGGSCADTNYEHKWSIFTQKKAERHGMSVSLIFSQKKMLTTFTTGFYPTELKGRVTESNNRTLYTIDDQRAIDVYRAWTKPHIDIDDQYKSLFDITSMYPIGRKVQTSSGLEHYKLTHLTSKSVDDGINLFTSLSVGDEIVLMRGDVEMLITRASKLISLAQNDNILQKPIVGAINIFCAGSMLQIESSLALICRDLQIALNHQPFLCPFTYGEQGQFYDGEVVHGNLMFSSVVFTD